jgi:hypothetical protein
VNAGVPTGPLLAVPPEPLPLVEPLPPPELLPLLLPDPLPEELPPRTLLHRLELTVTPDAAAKFVESVE